MIRVFNLKSSSVNPITPITLESAFVNVADLFEERKLEDFEPMCSTAVPSLRKTLDDPKAKCRVERGRPALLCITGNAMRAADLARGLRALLPKSDSPQTAKASAKLKKSGGKVMDGRRNVAEKGTDAREPGKGDDETAEGSAAQPWPTVAKLFARHFKLAEQVAFLSTHISPLAVGTPARVADLLKHEAAPAAAETCAAAALSLAELELLVIDASWKDAKERTVVDGLETRGELFKLLNRDVIKERIKDKRCKLLLF
ncbi:hypothetical protein K437DRAFT_68327 [Tilletiaria anomala UBC 951]|uniref:Uncharacterized protein n=1 Tax=Tilletiaria anomala (strain ATCC 24038 / CBS 436.72 / UBC 951) TaxID=1037660 RepID=A0A066VA88_TILAU|nr:uncharacterized protein K437DRAFT_68327 [Tilletiaria anomala UBC 951]KDN35679.1 hypothetical protein K437DRAFT_68327 [Tilletiaria anomala UBC 951]